jgi:hypothetical protein
MSDEIHDVTTITFIGPRFDDAGMDLDMLSELLTYRKVLIETAKELWRRENRGRRVPKGYEESIRLKIYSIEAGSVAVPIKRIIARHDWFSAAALQDADEIDDAALLIDETIAAVAEERPIPERMPRRALRLLATFGKNLREGESIKTQSIRSAAPATLTYAIRQRFAQPFAPASTGSREELHEMPAVFIERTPTVIRDAPLAKTAAKLRRTDDDELEGETDDDPVQSLLQSLIDLGASLPPEEWDRLPKDLASNLDHYLYGSSSEDE